MAIKETIIHNQESYLQDLKKSKKTVDIHLINGIILKCKVLKSDNFSILVDIGNKKSLVYKHSIAYIK